MIQLWAAFEDVSLPCKSEKLTEKHFETFVSPNRDTVVFCPLAKRSFFFIAVETVNFYFN